MRNKSATWMRLQDPEVFRAWILMHGLSYSDLALLVGCSKQFISQLATAKRTTCRPELARKFERILLPAPDMRAPGVEPLFVEHQRRKDPWSEVPVDHRELGMRFMARVDVRGPRECWPWLRRDGKANGYYGSIYVAGRSEQAHRVAYTLFIGPIPEGMEVDHVVERGCTRLDCVNPAHLEAVTHSENVKRGWAAKARRLKAAAAEATTDIPKLSE